ncbi:MAG: division/cell wall cluster transcriptional repressor MraZ [Eubacterium sp.]|nr:division/cell wall cluster transcriptional repressor MraZ [Eubacterium sp.]
MLFGEYAHNIDDKGRLIIPSKFRDALGETFVITKGLDHCLFVFSMTEWTVFQDKLRALPISDKDARSFSRFFFSGAAECTLDKQGRISVPQSLRKYAKLDKETRIIGVANRLEIWNADDWDSYADIDASDIEDKMAELGI